MRLVVSSLSDFIHIFASEWYAELDRSAHLLLSDRASLAYLAILVAMAFPLRLFSEDRKKPPNQQSKLTATLEVDAEIQSLKMECLSLRKDIIDLEHALFVSAIRFKTFINNMPTPAFTLNEVGNVVEWNGEAERLFGLKVHQVIDQPVMNIVGPQAFRYLADKALYMVYLGKQVKPVRCKLKTRRQVVEDLVWHITPILDIDQKVQGAVVNLTLL